MSTRDEVDYRDMLARYIRHVDMEEGTDFLSYREGYMSDVKWTDAEWTELQTLRRLP